MVNKNKLRSWIIIFNIKRYNEPKLEKYLDLQMHMKPLQPPLLMIDDKSEVKVVKDTII